MPVSFIAMLLHCCVHHQTAVNDNESKRIVMFSHEARQYCQLHHYNTSVFFLVDMQIHSGKKRFFVVDINHDSIITSGMVAHGACGIFFSATASFSNKPGCYCSSLGRYKTGNKYAGRFGNAYKLHGLDSTNSNAYKRNIVLHSYYEVPDAEIYPAHVCNSQGCTMVSDNFFKALSSIIDASKKPVLLWIIN